jgi:hypothetical protein
MEGSRTVLIDYLCSVAIGSDASVVLLTIDSSGEYSGPDFTVHQEHYAFGYSESSSTTTYGAGGEETTIKKSSYSSFSRTLSWENSADFVAEGYDYPTFTGDIRHSSRATIPAAGTPSGENKNSFNARLQNESGEEYFGGTDFPNGGFTPGDYQGGGIWARSSLGTHNPFNPAPIKPLNWKSAVAEPPGVIGAFFGGLGYGAVEVANSTTKLVSLGYADLEEWADDVAERNGIDDDTRTKTRVIADGSVMIGSFAVSGGGLARLLRSDVVEGRVRSSGEPPRQAAT